LVVVQFALSIFLIICTFIVSSQLQYMKTRKLGFEKEQLVSVTIPFEYENKYDALKNELLKRSDIIHVTRMRNFPTSDQVNSYSGLDWERKNSKEKVLFCIHDVDNDFFETFGMTMTEGRGFSKTFPTDSNAYILNEKAVEIMGIQNPVGKRFSQDDRTGNIVGVVKNFHFKSLKNDIEPLVFRLPINHANRIFIKISAHDMTATIGYIERMWEKLVPDYPFAFLFLDEAYDKLYHAENRTDTLLRHFTFLAFLITGLGLFGLTSFVAEQRAKEIAVRMVLGASVFNIVAKLSKEFVVLVVIANTVAWPVAYFVMKAWIQSYRYRTDIGCWLFFLAGLIAIVIALLTVSYQTMKAALADPADSLRYE
jgi:putative ABC transport system permease protein